MLFTLVLVYGMAGSPSVVVRDLSAETCAATLSQQARENWMRVGFCVPQAR